MQIKAKWLYSSRTLFFDTCCCPVFGTNMFTFEQARLDSKYPEHVWNMLKTALVPRPTPYDLPMPAIPPPLLLPLWSARGNAPFVCQPFYAAELHGLCRCYRPHICYRIAPCGGSAHGNAVRLIIPPCRYTRRGSHGSTSTVRL